MPEKKTFLAWFGERLPRRDEILFQLLPWIRYYWNTWMVNSRSISALFLDFSELLSETTNA